MRKAIFILCLILSAWSFAHATNLDRLWAKGNDFYTKAAYDSAILIYNAISDSGYVSSELHYNLGNSYFKKKNYAYAILNYEKALKLNPDNEDARFNLSMSNLYVVDKIVPLPELFYKTWWQSTVQLFSEKVWSIISIVCIWVVLLFSFLFVISKTTGNKKLFFYLGLSMCVVLTFSIALASASKDSMLYGNQAIVIETSTYVKSSPDEKGIDLFILHEGVKLRIIDSIGIWKRIRLANGNEGWLKSEMIESI